MPKLMTKLMCLAMVALLFTLMAKADDSFNPSLTIQCQQPTKPQSDDHPVNKLKKQITTDFDAQRLDLVFKHIADIADVNINIDWVSLIHAGIEPDMPITLKFTHKIPAQHILETVLQQASSNNELDPIWHDENQWMVNIAAKQKLLRNNRIIIVYDVNDLILQFSKYKVNNCPQGKQNDHVVGTYMLKMMDLIRSQPPQEMWVEFGGDLASIQQINGKLIVNAHRSIQEQVENIIHQIRTNHVSIDIPFDINLPKNQHGVKLRKLISVDLDQVKLETALMYIAKAANVSMMIDWKRIINTGIKKDFPVTLKMNQKIPANIALDIILAQASAHNELDPIWHHETKSYVDISTRRMVLRTNSYFKSYDIRDIVVDTEKHIVNYSKNAAKTDEGKNWPANSLLKLIRSQIAPTTWDKAGGDASSVRELNGLLLIRAHDSIHKQVTQLLTALRTISIPVPEVRASRPLGRRGRNGSFDVGHANSSRSRRSAIDQSSRRGDH